MEITTFLIFALISFIFYIFLKQKDDARKQSEKEAKEDKEFERQIRILDYKIKQDNTNFQRFFTEKQFNFEAKKWSEENNSRIEQRNFDNDLRLKEHQLNVQIADSNMVVRLIELENQKITNIIAYAKSQDENTENLILSKLNVQTQKYLRDIELLSHLETKEAEKRKKKILFGLDESLDNIISDLKDFNVS